MQYNTTTDTYEPWASRPTGTSITLTGSETATIDVDSTGRMWLATENGANLNVYYSDSPYTAFSGPVTLASNINGDDIGVVTALPNNTDRRPLVEPDDQAFRVQGPRRRRCARHVER